MSRHPYWDGDRYVLFLGLWPAGAPQNIQPIYFISNKESTETLQKPQPTCSKLHHLQSLRTSQRDSEYQFPYGKSYGRGSSFCGWIFFVKKSESCSRILRKSFRVPTRNTYYSMVQYVPQAVQPLASTKHHVPSAVSQS